MVSVLKLRMSLDIKDILRMVKPDTKAFGDALNEGILVSPNTRLAQD